MEWWKVVGLAGLAGVAATGVKISRDERQRKAYTPDEIRSRLHARADTPLDAEQEPSAEGPSAQEPSAQDSDTHEADAPEPVEQKS